VASPYREQPVALPLTRFVECCWSFVNENALHQHAVRPDGCLDLLYSSTEGLRVVGAMTSEKRVDLAANHSSFGLRFRPGMARVFLGIAAAELTDSTIEAENLLGVQAKEAEARLAAARSAEDCMRILTAIIGMPKAHEPNGVQRAIEAVTAQHGAVDLDRIASQAKLSPRQFRRRCLEESGLSPKQLCRILRFRRALQLAQRDAKPEWAGIAADTGYFDQSHLIRDFREFGGSTPVSVFSNPF
jgi:AraC-like DNA-binding protein